MLERDRVGLAVDSPDVLVPAEIAAEVEAAPRSIAMQIPEMPRTLPVEQGPVDTGAVVIVADISPVMPSEALAEAPTDIPTEALRPIATHTPLTSTCVPEGQV